MQAEPKQPGSDLYALVPKAPSLDQAGGLQRMTLRGHTAGISKILLAEGGIDVVTGAGPCPSAPCIAAAVPARRLEQGC